MLFQDDVSLLREVGRRGAIVWKGDEEKRGEGQA
jgi:hypothetical protein